MPSPSPSSARPGAAFRRGFADALPICFGYFAVGFTVALAAVVNGHPLWSPILLSLTHVSGTSQGAIVDHVNLATGVSSGFGELVLLCVALNLRYVLLALAVAQRLGPGVGLGRRLVLAMGITDENVALAVSRPFALGFPYLAGLFLSSYLGWNGGTLLGALGASLLPGSALAPLGIALYAMFIAIVVPAARASRPTLLCVALGAGLNAALALLPASVRPSAGVSILLAGSVAAAACAALFPSRPASAEKPRAEDGP